MATSPTQLTLKLMRSRGYTCEVVERWNPFTKTRHDLFNFIDILCLGEGEIIGVQTTSRSNMSTRAKKIREHENLLPVLDSGIRIWIQGWEKNKSGRWEVRESEIKFVDTEDDTEVESGVSSAPP